MMVHFNPMLTSLLLLWTNVNGLVPSNKTTDASSTLPYFIKKGERFLVVARHALDIYERLPTATYTVGIDPSDRSLFLKQIEDFSIEGKIYGDTVHHANRILHPFLARQGSTGVLLSGEKGSGKTFLAKYISVQAAKEQDIPTIVINQALSGERFNAFIQSIQQPSIILFDEFEKTYRPPKEQEAMEMQMQMEEGHYVNDKHKITTNMRNRPGRIYYTLDFAGLTPEFIREYCSDNLSSYSKHVEQIVSIAGLFEAFNFDMLQAMVQEMNLYDESPRDVLKWLNVRPEFGGMSQFVIQQLTVGGNDVPEKSLAENQWYGNPMKNVIHIRYLKDQEEAQPKKVNTAIDVRLEELMNDKLNSKRGGRRVEGVEFTSVQLEGMNGALGTFVFYNPERKARLVLQRKGVATSTIDFDKLPASTANADGTASVPPSS